MTLVLMECQVRFWAGQGTRMGGCSGAVLY